MKKLKFRGKNVVKLDARVIAHEGNGCIEVKIWSSLEPRPRRITMSFLNLAWYETYIKAIKEDVFENCLKKL
ncbi:hypothetical protein ACFL2G_05320 [Candidatus Omnitrophota bacterium]